MKLVEALGSAGEEVLREASGALGRAHLKHYEMTEPEESDRRLKELLALIVECIAGRTLVPVCHYTETVARERFAAGFDIGEVQTTFNVLEEAIWHVVVLRLPPAEVAEAAGLVGTIVGTGKDTLARTWVSLATSQHVPTLDLTALFQGAGG